MNYHTIIVYPKLQPDTLLSIFLLKKFGENVFPGISSAKITYWSKLPDNQTASQLEANGNILIDVGDGMFDHHKQLVNGKPIYTSSQLVAIKLGVNDDPALNKLLSYARRDDLEGKGIISTDPLDRAFGLSGIINNLLKAYPTHLDYIVDTVIRIFNAQYVEDEKRTKILPEKFRQLKRENKVVEWTVRQNNNTLKVVQLPTDDSSFPGFVRAWGRFDVVIARTPTNHINIITRQVRRINLKNVIRNIRLAEAKKKDSNIYLSELDLTKQGRISQIPIWFYDTMANTIQNGGVDPQNILPTQLNDDEIRISVTNGLADSFS